MDRIYRDIRQGKQLMLKDCLRIMEEQGLIVDRFLPDDGYGFSIVEFRKEEE